MESKGKKPVKKEKTFPPPKRGMIKAKIFGEIAESLENAITNICYGSEEDMSSQKHVSSAQHESTTRN